MVLNDLVDGIHKNKPTDGTFPDEVLSIEVSHVIRHW
jgi:hypothetical protein